MHLKGNGNTLYFHFFIFIPVTVVTVVTDSPVIYQTSIISICYNYRYNVKSGNWAVTDGNRL